MRLAIMMLCVVFVVVITEVIVAHARAQARAMEERRRVL